MDFKKKYTMTTQTFTIPTHCKAGVVENEGPDFRVRVEDVPVPEPGTNHLSIEPSSNLSNEEFNHACQPRPR
jgi:hypothetical protein